MRAWRALAPFLILSVSVQLASWGCSSRVETPVIGADSTVVYAAKKPGGVTASITLCRSLSKKTGKPVDEGQVFTLGEKAKVRAIVDLENRPAPGSRDLMFHLVWLGPGDEEIFRKRIDYSPSDSSTALESSLSIPPDRREPGQYDFQVYLFRELIAEKRFELRLGAERPSGAVSGAKKRSDV